MAPALEPLEQVGPGTWQIASELSGRRLHQHLIADGGDALLIDAGIASTPQAVIAPALAGAGVGPEQLSLIVITHPDVDHQGGAAAMRALAPGARLACGFLDVPYVGDPELMVRGRYRAYATDHGLDFSDDQLEGMRADLGAPVAVDAALSGGEVLRVGSRSLEVVHAPGHAAGHVALADRASGDVFMADAVHGRGSPAIDGTMALPPTYEEVDDYLATIQTIRALAPRRLYSGHLPVLEGAQIEAFLSDSEVFVDELDQLLLGAAESPLTLAELCGRADEGFGPFPAGAFYFMFCVHGHVRRLVRRGELEDVGPLEQPRRYRRT